MYPDADDESASQRTLGLVEPHLRSIIRRRKPKAKTLLDVGCGYGVFLKFMEDHGLQLHGIEMSATAADYTQRVLPEAVIVQGDLASAEFEPGSMDVITMIAALEHVFDPRATLRQLTRWLAPEGLLIVQVPYTTPYLKLKRFIPWLPVYLAAPAHLYDFNPTTLRRYFDVAGLKHSEIDIARPYAAPNRLSALAIWGVKLPGIALHRISGRRYVYPFASAIVCHGVKTV
jgi:SAM-dependent methyltransferase